MHRSIRIIRLTFAVILGILLCLPQAKEILAIDGVALSLEGTSRTGIGQSAQIAVMADLPGNIDSYEMNFTYPSDSFDFIDAESPTGYELNVSQSAAGGLTISASGQQLLAGNHRLVLLSFVALAAPGGRITLNDSSFTMPDGTNLPSSGMIYHYLTTSGEETSMVSSAATSSDSKSSESSPTSTEADIGTNNSTHGKSDSTSTSSEMSTVPQNNDSPTSSGEDSSNPTSQNQPGLIVAGLAAAGLLVAAGVIFMQIRRRG